MTSCRVSSSMALMRSTLKAARDWMRFRSAAGTRPSLCMASQASTSMRSQIRNRFSSVQMPPISGDVYRGIMLSVPPPAVARDSIAPVATTSTLIAGNGAQSASGLHNHFFLSATRPHLRQT